jgi:RNA polymerase sigma factor (sigma-70 family)
LLVKMTLAAATPADAELLRRYADERSETAFAELVRRHLDLVHSAALRQVGGNRAAAADIAQAVFTELARQANHLTRHPALVGWLYTTTHRLAARHVRDESRRQRREREAHAMQETHHSNDPEVDWSRLAPVLDEAMHELAEADRIALLLRHFQQRPFAEVGARLGLSENAARMRVERALDRLRGRLAKRGITSTGSALALALGGPAVVAAPAGLATNIAAGAVAAGALTASTFGLLSFMASTKLKIGAVVVGFGLLGTALLVQQQHLQRLRTDRSELTAQLAEQSAALRNAQQLAARKDAELAASQDSRAELLRLRGEVARLRRQAAKPAAQPDATPESKPSPPLITNVRTQVPPGATMVVGGWNWSEGRRALLFLTPVTRQDDGKSVVDVESRITLIPEGTLTEFGLGRFATSDDPEAHEMMATAQVQEMFDRLFQLKDIETLQSAQMTTGDGQQAAVGISSDDLPDVVVVEVTPTVLPDGRIDVTLAGKLRPRPDAKAP